MSWSSASPYIPSFSDDPSRRGRAGFRPRGPAARPPFSRPHQPSYRTNRFPAEEPPPQSNDAINFEAYESVPVEASGTNVPPPVNTFSETDLEERLKRNIERCKYVKPTPVQRHAIPIVTAGRDLMACAQTGSGKTAAFCFPIISGILKTRSSASGFSSVSRGPALAYPTALILSPTRELSCQISDEANKFAYQTGVKVVVAYGGAPINHQLRLLERGVDILVATPGRLVDIIERERVSLTRIKYLALDEADRMLDMGFEHQIRKIVQQMQMPPPGVRQTLLFSATFPSDIQKLASDFLSNYVFLSVGRIGSSTELIEQKIELVQDMDKRDHLFDHLSRQMSRGANGKHALTLVFVETKRGADALESWMLECGFGAVAIHGDKVQMERERALRSFKSGLTPILVATDVASRGLDIPHVSHVINYDLPREIDSYVHRIGRTGRAGKSGLATAFFSEKNSPIAKALIGLLQEAKQEVPSWLNRYAEYSPSGGGGGCGYGSQCYSSGTYGGHDFRNVSEPEVQNYNGYSTYGSAEFADTSYTDSSYDMQNSNIESSFDSLNITSAASFNHTNSMTSAASYNHPDVNSGDVCGSIRVQEDGPCGYSTIVATGWD